MRRETLCTARLCVGKSCPGTFVRRFVHRMTLAIRRFFSFFVNTLSIHFRRESSVRRIVLFLFVYGPWRPPEGGGGRAGGQGPCAVQGQSA